MRLALSSRLLKTAADFEVEYEFATTQAVYDGETTRDLLDFLHDKIRPEDVYESEEAGIKGVEQKPHVTLLYGIREHKPNVLKIQQIIQNHPALTHVGWLGLGKFEAPKYDVLIIEVESPEAQEIFADLNQFYPDNSNSYPDYHPHTCLAYLKKGTADEYIEKYSEAFIDPSVPISRLEFEFNGEVTEFDPNYSKVLEVKTANVKTQKGTPIRRSRLGVGKDIGGAIYLHRTYLNSLPDQEGLQKAQQALPEGFEWNCLKAASDGSYTFFNSPDFDTADEPTAGPYARVGKDGAVSKGRTDSIWHHKWLWVRDDYPGFDVAASKERSRKWTNLPDIDYTRIGRRDFWNQNVVPRINSE